MKTEIDQLYSDLPEDNELAFLQLERVYRSELTEQIKGAGQNAHPMLYLDYVNQTKAAASALGLTVLGDTPEPDFGNSEALYAAIGPKIQALVVNVSIKHGRRAKGYSVSLNPETKTRIRSSLGTNTFYR